METIIIAVISVTAIGAVCAAVLCAASKFMAVKVDERVVRILECLPGTNCGACGFPGCSAYAFELTSENGWNIKNNCTPGGAEVSKKINEIIGGDAGDSEFVKKVAVIRCAGNSDSQQKKMEYNGIKTCMAAKQIFSGERMCAFGCIGYADCQVICPSDAVCMENGHAQIISHLCTGCALCVKACPNNLITIEPENITVFVACRNIEKPAVVRKKCSIGCLGCGKCVRECSANAMMIKEYLAIIDYEKCTGCGHCAEICITKCIHLQNQ